jgi:hypothetical protein
VIGKQQGRGKSTVASYLAGVFLSFWHCVCCWGAPRWAWFLECFREFALYGGVGRKYGCLGVALCN